MASNSTTVYGGDDINAIVLDPGSYNSRIGYAGDDFPKIVTESFYATPNEEAMEIDGKPRRIFGESINVPRPNYDIKPILKDSVIIDWDAALEQYEYYFKDVMKIDYQEQPILITEPIWTESSYRKTLIENFYENFQFSALYLAKTPSCVSFQQGRPNCLVVDIGHDSISVTPVIDGISLMKHSVRTHYGGQFINDQIEDLIINQKKIKFEPKYKIKSKTGTTYPQEPIYSLKTPEFENITKSFEDYQRQKVWHEFKETMLEIPDRSFLINNIQQKTQVKEFYSQDSHKRLFELPTGQSIEMGIERFQLADSIFHPELAKFDENSSFASKYPHENGELSLENKYDDYKPLKRVRKNESNQSTPPPSETGDSSTTPPKTTIRGLGQLITYTLSTINIDLRAAVAHNIIVTGGLSLVSQLTERLYNELSNSNPGLKIRLHAVGNSSERVNQAWIGGSVLSSLGTFHQMWVTKQEYEEAGVDRILNQRFR